jgi:hypothetical protein
VSKKSQPKGLERKHETRKVLQTFPNPKKGTRTNSDRDPNTQRKEQHKNKNNKKKTQNS